jgi:hypothetical protein
MKKVAKIYPGSPPSFIGGHELKVTYGTLATAVTTTAANFDMSQYIAGGSGFNSGRIGNVIEPNSVSFQGVLMGGQSNVVADDKYNIFRVIVTWATVAGLAAFNPSLVSGVNCRTFPGIEEVLYDQTFCLSSPGPDSVGYMPPTKAVKFSIPLRNKKIFFNGTGQGSQCDRTIGITCVSDSAVAPSPGFQSGVACMTYLDN